eukprot:6178800-Pleurochrysis_carterae.AAC.3
MKHWCTVAIRSREFLIYYKTCSSSGHVRARRLSYDCARYQRATVRATSTVIASKTFRAGLVAGATSRKPARALHVTHRAGVGNSRGPQNQGGVNIESSLPAPVPHSLQEEGQEEGRACQAHAPGRGREAMRDH